MCEKVTIRKKWKITWALLHVLYVRGVVGKNQILFWRVTKVQTYLLRTTTTKILEMKMLYVFGTHSFYEILLRNFEVSIFLMPWKKNLRYRIPPPLLRSSSWFLLRGRGTILMVAARRTGFLSV